MTRGIVWAAGFLVFIMAFYLDREAGLFLGCALNVVLSWALVPRKMWIWIPAVVISWIWVVLARDLYAGYNVFRASFGGVTLFPALAWPNLLVLLYFWVYPLVPARSWWRKWLRLSLLYAGLLILLEYAGYHFAGVHLDAGRGYPGWPLLDIFHCPWWMQAAYFLNGIVFSGVAAWVTERRPTLTLAGRKAHDGGARPIPR